MTFIVLLIEYIILAFFCYNLLWKLDLGFYRKGKEIELSHKDKKYLLIVMSILWIFYLPKLLIDYFRR